MHYHRHLKLYTYLPIPLHYLQIHPHMNHHCQKIKLNTINHYLQTHHYLLLLYHLLIHCHLLNHHHHLLHHHLLTNHHLLYQLYNKNNNYLSILLEIKIFLKIRELPSSFQTSHVIHLQTHIHTSFYQNNNPSFGS
jgi:hypothetical protein